MGIRMACLIGLVLFAAAALQAAQPSLSLVPWPKSVEVKAGLLSLEPRSRVVAADKTLAPLAAVLVQDIHRMTGLQLATGEGAARTGDILLVLDKGLKGEAYTLSVSGSAVVAGDAPRRQGRQPCEDGD